MSSWHSLITMARIVEVVMSDKSFTDEPKASKDVTKPAALQTAEGHVPNVSGEAEGPPQARGYNRWYVMDGQTVLNKETGERSAK